MSNQKKNEQESLLKELGIRTTPSEFDSASVPELQAENLRLENEIKKLELAEKIENLAARKRKLAQKKSEFDAKNREILMELRRRAARMVGCSHRKGGTAVAGQRNPLPEGGGDADVFALLKHQLPTGDWLVTCQRCGAEWMPADRFTGKPATVIGGFTYKDALLARTDNSPSKSAVFKLEDHRTDAEIEADKWHPPVDEHGNPVKDIYAQPPNNDGPLQPPGAISRR